MQRRRPVAGTLLGAAALACAALAAPNDELAQLQLGLPSQVELLPRASAARRRHAPSPPSTPPRQGAWVRLVGISGRYTNTAALHIKGQGCRTWARVGQPESAAHCSSLVASHAGCGDHFMFSSSVWQWGCLCCVPGDEGQGVPGNPAWDVYRMVWDLPLNELEGRIVGHDQEGDLWRVRTRNGQEHGIRRENLEVLDVGPLGDHGLPALERLRGDSLFLAAREPGPGGARTVRDGGGCDFQGGGVHCSIEFPEHKLVRDWIPKHAVVMELGARYGTTTCEIAKQLGNSGRLVAVEPDAYAWDALASNLDSHNCHAHVLRGTVGSQPLFVGGHTGYGLRTQSASSAGAEARGFFTQNFRIDEVEEALGLKIDTLLVDCEGCVALMLDDLAPKIRSGQINLVLLEADGAIEKDCTGECVDYEKLFTLLRDSGLEMVDKFNDCDEALHGLEKSWCNAQIEHYAFRRS